jgi:hypothetical protein
VTVVDNAKGDWRRVYIDRELIAENHPMRINLVSVLREVSKKSGCKRCGNSVGYIFKTEKVENFNLLEESGGVAQS